jgi:hypothetical protein
MAMITDEMVEAAARAIMQDEFFVAGQPVEPVYRMARAVLEAAEKVQSAQPAERLRKWTADFVAAQQTT